MSTSEGRYEIEAAKLRLAAAKKQVSSAQNLMSSAEEMYDNSATLPRSNISSPQKHSTKQHQQQQQSALSLQSSTTKNNTNSSIEGKKATSPAVIELSSLFQTESTLFRDASQHSSGKNKFFVTVRLYI